MLAGEGPAFREVQDPAQVGASLSLCYTAGFYTGNEQVFLPSNTLFRMGGAACILSTRWADHHAPTRPAGW